jgi:hypothetical protein
MDFWTFLVITLAAPYEGHVSMIPYPNAMACGQAMEPVMATIPMSIDMAQCIETDVLSFSIRPKRRPEGIANE